MTKIPRCMSSQHPDNSRIPFFVSQEVIEGEDEIKEAYYAFSHLGCEEQMWDCEGKEVDDFVVKKLLSEHEDFFRETVLGEDVFLTLRIPNPTVERDESKILVETLESISRSFDIAKKFYGKDIAPIFEVIVPMTSSEKCLNRVYHYYKDFVAAKQDRKLFEGDISVGEWLGEFKPKEINVIPLLEEKEFMLNAHRIVENYLADKKVEHQRVFLARSDPALNYGLVSAVLANKIALQRLHGLEQKISVDLYPIIGVGSAPFRGNLTPLNPKNCLKGYPSIQTFTIQSAFKYDFPEKKIVQAIEEIKSTKRKKPIQVEEEKAEAIIEKVSKEYFEQIKVLAPVINGLANFIPPRRKRKLHIGLFGYSRNRGKLSLPRAIRFCASLYSVGLPPEILGVNALNSSEFDFVSEVYPGFSEDVCAGLKYLNEDNLRLLPGKLSEKLLKAVKLFEFGIDEEHKEITSEVFSDFRKQRSTEMKDNIVKAALIRRFLG